MNNNLRVFSFSGSHCVGKTTLVDCLLKVNLHERDILFSPSNSTDLKKLEDTTLETKQVLLVTRELETLIDLQEQNPEISKVILKDRCILDTLIYSRYFRKKGLLSETGLRLIEASAEKILPRYDRIFIIPVIDNIAFRERDKFSMGDDSRQTVSDLFVEFYNEYKDIYNLTLLVTPQLRDRSHLVQGFLNRALQDCQNENTRFGTVQLLNTNVS